MAVEISATPEPTRETSRFNSLDVLRGFAVLAIFVVNVKMMANGYNHYVNFKLWSGESVELIGLLHSRLVHGKFVTIFTALFGAGLALLLAREKPVPLAVVARRLFWLAIFGGLHLIFIREGDILILYALAGVLAIPFVRYSARTLLVVGLGLHVAAFVYSKVFPLAETGIPVLWRFTPDAHEEVAAIMLGPVAGHIAARLEAVPYYILDLFVIGGGWIDKLSLMLIGMAMLKTGFLSGVRNLKSYIFWGCVGLAIALTFYAVRPFLDEEGIQGEILGVARHIHYYGGALAWSALIVGAVVAGWRGSAFAAVGRMAFTVYILQSVIGLLLFSSLGLGLFGQLTLIEVSGVTVAVWVFFLIAAPLWLRSFYFGPLEWIWRSLTYRRWQPLRR